MSLLAHKHVHILEVDGRAEQVFESVFEARKEARKALCRVGVSEVSVISVRQDRAGPYLKQLTEEPSDE
jgi:hypothetical protein